ncbi:MAG: 6-phosphofructokinase [Bdellovibrionales bacterium]|nr:6-phosphofructokinase [Bdellovibrionales bacterium]
MREGRFGIVVSGGPAPGINSTVYSVVDRAERAGYQTIGFCDGFEGALSDPKKLVNLTAATIAPFRERGGSYLGTSRYNPLADKTRTSLLARLLCENQIDKLVVIGGDGSAYLSYQLSQEMSGIKVAHLPKTIDNDLPLPHHYPSFGFESAREMGVAITRTLLADARTTKRWFLVKCMGRQSGFLALAIGMAVGASVILIPEEYRSGEIPLSQIIERISNCILARRKQGKEYGVALFAEGLLNCLNAQSLPALNSRARDKLGRLRYSEIELEELLRDALQVHPPIKELDVQLSVKNIGYELRCCDPIGFDLEYTQFLGEGAVRFLLDGLSGFMVVRDYDRIGFVELAKLRDPTGKIQTQQVSLESDLYRVARSEIAPC